MLSDALNEYGEEITDEALEILAYGCLSPHHAGQFKAFIKQIKNRYQLSAIMDGDERWPYKPEDFPTDGPLLIITDGYCESLKIQREHAFLMPKGYNLPFLPKGKVFRFS